MSPNSSAKSRELPGIDLAELGEAHAAEAGEQRAQSTFELVGVGRRQQDADLLAAATRPAAVTPATAMRSVRSPSRRLSGTSAIIPKSMNVSWKFRPDSPAPAWTGVTKMLPGAGRRAQEAVREHLVEHDLGEHRGDRGRVDAAARSASVSLILIAVTSDSVSTRRVDRSHTISGAATRGSSAKFSRNRSARSRLRAGSRSPRGWSRRTPRPTRGASTRSATMRTRVSQRATRRSAAARSTATMPSMPGRCTLTTTWPSPVSARVQCREPGPVHPDPREAAARAECRRTTRRQRSSGRRVRPRRAPADGRGGHGRHLVLQPLELFRDLGRQHVEAATT